MIINGERALAYIAEISEILPIEGADRIEVARVGGWQVVVAKKDNFAVGDSVIYIEIDSKVPADMECFAFLKDRKYKVKTIKLRKQISQGLIMPLSILPPGQYEVGQDVTNILGIKKIEDEVTKKSNQSKEMQLRHYHKKLTKMRWFKWLMKYEWFRKLVFKYLIPKKKASSFPTCFEGVTKSDQERVENMPWVLNDKRPFIVTTKVDGTSSTYILDKSKRKEEFWVLSRNVRQDSETKSNYHSPDGSENVYWQVADKYKIKEFLSAMIDRFKLDWAAIQGETAGVSEGGAKIQGDPHKLGELRFFGYDMMFSGKGKINIMAAAGFAEEFGIEWVPIVNPNFILPDTMEEFKAQATGECEIPGASGLREGYVYRLKEDTSFSFKNVSNDYLMKNNL